MPTRCWLLGLVPLAGFGPVATQGVSVTLYAGPPAATSHVDKIPAVPSPNPHPSDHWAFRTPARPPVPAVRGGRAANPIDAFVLARLEAAGLRPAPAAEKVTQLRRLTFGLTGLPPTVELQERFLNDPAPDAYERLADSLLASPHYGERWAQHWLDVVRYAESNGYEADAERPHAWRYRDYVVRSLNADKPFDRFVAEQVAGDELAAGEADPARRSELLVATGLHRCGPIHVTSGNTDPDENRQEFLTEVVQGVGAAVLGLTVNCARCHDHKFDPVSIDEYYRFQAFFAAAGPREADVASAAEKAAVNVHTAAITSRIAPLKAKVAEIDAPHRARLAEAKRAKLDAKYRDALAADPKARTPEQKKLAEEAKPLLKVAWDEVVAALSPAERERRAALRAEIHALQGRLPPPAAQAWCVQNAEPVPPTHVLKRGDVKAKGAVVTPGVPAVLGAGPAALKTRTDLARWLTRPDHPLTARVIVNRLWQHHFGRGLVATPNDFGKNGEPPTHPELLDWLAAELVERGWSLKAIHRLIVTSNTYRQSGAASADARRLDPDNRLWSRVPRRRLQGEAVRDAMLAAAGVLNAKVGGPMVRVPLEPEVYDLIFTEDEPDGLWRVTPDPAEHRRRSLYLFAKRNVRLPLLEAFDQPDTLTPCGCRPVSTFAPQALILMNGPFAREQARAMAATLVGECGTDADRLVERAYRRAFARPPRDGERTAGRDFLASQAELVRERLVARRPAGVPAVPPSVDPALAAALADYCLALLNTSEFVYAP